MDLLLLIGITIALGFIGGKLSNKLKFPAVIGYIIIGILLGPSLFGIFDLSLLNRMGIISDFALGLIAFIIGEELRLGILRKMGKTVMSILFVESIFTFILIAVGIYLLTRDIALSLILGALGVATAPAGTFVVLREYKAKGPLTNTLLAIVGLDDGVAIIIYGFASAFAKISIGGNERITIQNTFEGPLVEIGGAVVIGIVLGIALSYVARKLHERDELLTISLVSILICTGLANIFHFSSILANLVLGMTTANIFLLTGKRIFGAIEGITSPIYIAFFVLAGAHLQIGVIPKMGLLGLIYVLTRSFAKIGGASLGAYLSKAEGNIQKYLGFGLFTQAGVAIGLAMVVQREFGLYGELATITITTITATTIILEIIGPLGVKYAITRAGEIGQAK
ncbi:MAG: cation:proton antiporter [Elusimicrobiota bacterium]|nr:cation:proton antiporter [Elusimicrobiota bacterium]